jgi:hypothetical protein
MVLVADAAPHIMHEGSQAQESKISAGESMERRENLDEGAGDSGDAPFMTRIAHP